MASKLLPQPTILALPRHVGPQQQPLRNLGFCASVSRNCKWGCRVVANNASFGAVNKRCSSFVVRAAEDELKAEDNAEENKEEVVQADGEVEGETKAEGDVDAEDMAEEETRTPRKPRVKLGDIMGILNKRAVEASETERPIPNIRTGDVVEIKLEVPENRRRLSIYKGIVISRQNAGIHTTIRIRRIIAGIGVEIVFPLYSPNIKEIKVVAHRKVRRARLYYLRDKLPRLSTFK